jgi:hypothetical protein
VRQGSGDVVNCLLAFGVEEIDLEKGRRSLGDIENTLGKLMD